MFRFINGRARDLMRHVTGELGEALREPGDHPLILLVPENPACDIELVSGEVDDVIVGRVVWIWQKLD